MLNWQQAFIYFISLIRSRGSLVVVVIGYELDYRGSINGRGNFPFRL